MLAMESFTIEGLAKKRFNDIGFEFHVNNGIYTLEFEGATIETTRTEVLNKAQEQLNTLIEVAKNKYAEDETIIQYAENYWISQGFHAYQDTVEDKLFVRIPMKLAKFDKDVQIHIDEIYQNALDFLTNKSVELFG